MKVGIFVNAAFCEKEKLDAVSGHVHVPLMVAKLLSDQAYAVSVITTRPRPQDVLPRMIPQSVPIHLVEHTARKWPAKGVHLAKVSKQMRQLSTLLREEHFDVLHFFGGTGVAFMAAFAGAMGTNTRVFFTPITRPWRSGILSSRLLKTLCYGTNRVVALSHYTADCWKVVCGCRKVSALRPGVVKLMPELNMNTPKDMILFWRNASYGNGADLAARAFAIMAPRYPHLRFVFAVRPGDVLDSDLLALARLVPNIEVHFWPYGHGVSLPCLLSNALFVVQPFRSLTINPQMSVLETLYAGVPVITTRIESNEELVEEGETGLLIPPDSESALTRAIEGLLGDRDLLATMRTNAQPHTKAVWNWDSFRLGLLDIYNNHD